jgi:hypothetical protein
VTEVDSSAHKGFGCTARVVVGVWRLAVAKESQRAMTPRVVARCLPFGASSRCIWCRDREEELAVRRQQCGDWHGDDHVGDL